MIGGSKNNNLSFVTRFIKDREKKVKNNSQFYGKLKTSYECKSIKLI